jgi:hypothetical protein
MDTSITDPPDARLRPPQRAARSPDHVASVTVPSRSMRRGSPGTVARCVVEQARLVMTMIQGAVSPVR